MNANAPGPNATSATSAPPLATATARGSTSRRSGQYRERTWGRSQTARRIARGARSAFAVLGIVLSGALLVGFVADVRNVDHTSGGYEAPYTDWTGTPIDWSTGSVSATGIRSRGYVFDTLIDCTTGMVSFELFKRRIDYRPVSPRAIAVHKPRGACRERGFEPRF